MVTCWRLIEAGGAGLQRLVGHSLQMVLLISLFGLINGCGTTAYLNKTYSGYRVIDKTQRVQNVWQETSLGTCVAPNGVIVMQERNPSETIAGECRPPLKFRFVDGPPQQVQVTYYNLLLESPKGERITFKASVDQYNSMEKGQIIGR